MGSGKSKLTDEIARATGALALHIDDFVVSSKEQRSYIDCLDLGAVREKIQCLPSYGTCILEGICLRDIAVRIHVEPAFYVYLKRISQAGLWNDGIDLEDFASGCWQSPGEPYLSDMSYHARVQPHEMASYVIHRIEN